MIESERKNVGEFFFETMSKFKAIVGIICENSIEKFTKDLQLKKTILNFENIKFYLQLIEDDNCTVAAS